MERFGWQDQISANGASPAHSGLAETQFCSLTSAVLISASGPQLGGAWFLSHPMSFKLILLSSTKTTVSYRHEVNTLLSICIKHFVSIMDFLLYVFLNFGS